MSALRLLALRELSEAQVRQRLAKRDHSPEDIDAAIDRLKAERALDDRRVAGAIARRETSFRKRGRRRVELALAKAGVDRDVARRALDEHFEQTDRTALIEEALARRLRGQSAIKDDAEFRRLYRYLAGQGFEADEILRTLHPRRRRGSGSED